MKNDQRTFSLEADFHSFSKTSSMPDTINYLSSYETLINGL